jgi:hypothetical protein
MCIALDYSAIYPTSFPGPFFENALVERVFQLEFSLKNRMTFLDRLGNRRKGGLEFLLPF